MQSSTNQQDPDQDQRPDHTMEDSNEMTIEFLRARLLSERSVSRTARQRADELAKRVVELDEQLKIISLQRKKAERATENVLAILKNHGISQFSEEFDSSSDQDLIPFESKFANNFSEEERLGSPMMRRNHMVELSGSEQETSLPVSSLSRKNGTNALLSEEKKHVDFSSRQTNSASTTSTSSKLRVCKSCSQILQSEIRSAVKESPADGNMLAHQENGDGIASCLECSPMFCDLGPEVLQKSSERKNEKILPEAPVSNARNYLSKHGSCKHMERALEHQKQLIGQFEEEEKAQREWEEKFRENNNNTPDSCEPRNLSDVREKGDKMKTHTSYPVATITSDTDPKLKLGDVGITIESDGLRTVSSVATRKQDQQHAQNTSIFPLHGHHSDSYSDDPIVHPSAEVISSYSVGSVFKADASRGKDRHDALITYETPDKLDSVLEALNHAKLSLRNKVEASSLTDGGSVGKAIEHSVGNRAEIAAGYTGLFNVPSGFNLKAASQSDHSSSNSRLHLTNFYPNARSMLTAGDQFLTTPCTVSRSRPSFSTGDRHLSMPTRHMGSSTRIPAWGPSDTLSGFSFGKQFFGPGFDIDQHLTSRETYSNPNMDRGLPSSGFYNSYPFHPDLQRQMHSNEGLQPISRMQAVVPPANQLLYRDHVTPNIYR